MTLKKKWTILLGITAILGLVIGGIVMFNPFTGEREPKYKQEQDRMARYIVDHVKLVNGDTIKKIEFVQFKKNNVTGTWRISTKINNNISISFAEDDLGKEFRTAGYSVKEIQVLDNYESNINLDKVNIIYYKE